MACTVVSPTTRPQLDAEGRVVRWYTLAEDIDKRKRAEAELEKAFRRNQAAERTGLHDENVVLREQIDQAFMFEEIVGSSPALKTVLSSIVKVAPTNSTGADYGRNRHRKELIARGHTQSSQTCHPGFYQRELRFDSSFAYRLGIVWPREGAFTGALQRHQGALNWRIPVRFFLMKSANFPRKLRLHCSECSRAPI